MAYQEHVWRPSRRINGKRVQSRLYVGRYFIDGMAKPKRVTLNTPDKVVALDRLRKRIVEKQREMEGLDAPKSQRVAAGRSLLDHLEDYKLSLVTLGTTAGQVKDTSRRIARMVAETGWLTLADVTADSFVRWLSSLKSSPKKTGPKKEISAKTRKEYQVSINAMLNWLVSVDRLARNPLAKLALVEIRGKQVRPSRPFTEDELARLYAVCGERALIYQFLVHTGMRKEEAHSLVWGDMHLDHAEAFAVIRAETTKDKEERRVWLIAELAAKLRAIRPAIVDKGKLVFPSLPHYETLCKDLKRAGIEQRDATGRVVHFHALRKTFSTLGKNHGMDLEARQQTLGHSTPDMTTNKYTDHGASSSYKEAAKIPWIEAKQSAQPDAHKSGAEGHLVSQAGNLAFEDQPDKPTGDEAFSHALSPPDTKDDWWWRLESNQ